MLAQYARAGEAKQSNEASRTAHHKEGAAYSPSPAMLRRQHFLGLQKTIGNQAVLRMLSRTAPAVQTKLRVNQPGDRFEQEADRVADQVMRMPEPVAAPATTGLQRKCSECEEEEKVQRKEVGAGPGVAPRIVHDVLSSPGEPLDPARRAFFEPRFGVDFDNVRVHTDTRAQDSSATLQALAYTRGNHIAFAGGQNDFASEAGRRLLAHELTHVVQQGGASQTLDRSKPEAPSEPTISLSGDGTLSRSLKPEPGIGVSKVGYLSIYFGSRDFIDLHTDDGIFRYALESHSDLAPGEYGSSVEVKGNNVTLTLDTAGGLLFHFRYRVEPGKPNPATLLSRQSNVTISVIADEAPELTKNKDTTDDRDPSVVPLTLEEAMRRCESGDLPGVKIFPFRGTRFGGAPISAQRDGDDIIVKSYVYVLSNRDFKAQTRTLPLETFFGGVRLKPNEIVRVHTYEPRWYHLNITGSTSGDIENEFCVTGEQMLDIARRSDIAVALNIGLTVIDAATLFIPVGKLAAMIGKPVAQAGRGLAVAALLGLRDAAPTAFAGIASRAAVVIEEQAVDQAASRAISTSTQYAVIAFGERTALPAAEAATQKAGEAVIEKAGNVAVSAAARTVTVTAVDATGHQVISSLTTPTGDAALDQAIDEAFSKTFDTSKSQAATQAAGQGVTAVAPEIAAGFTQAQVQAFKRLLARPLSDTNIGILGQLWDDAARAGDNAILNTGNSRYLFDLQRDRFWARVAANPQATGLITDAGCQFSGGAPYYLLNGRRITITIDHIIERQSAPNLALTASNLRLSFSRENSVVLRLLNQLSPF